MTYLGDIQMQMADMGHTCTDKQFMLHVLASLDCLSSSTNPLTLEELRAELNARYEKIKSKLN
jgi:hypothetical protein